MLFLPGSEPAVMPGFGYEGSSNGRVPSSHDGTPRSKRSMTNPFPSFVHWGPWCAGHRLRTPGNKKTKNKNKNNLKYKKTKKVDRVAIDSWSGWKDFVILLFFYVRFYRCFF